ncbi:YcbK family protein [Microvirga rosea]|uniref:YcbK family protein n=1 Tax=Microvirga rosea TaxID=2715425 RepID=UPI001D0AEAAC|nr:DUF882 domain-containing protein [Microvirga rosea]
MAAAAKAGEHFAFNFEVRHVGCRKATFFALQSERPIRFVRCSVIAACERGSGSGTRSDRWGRASGEPNELLRAEGAAINSLHMHSQACDIVVKDTSAEDIAEYVQSLGIGGLGKYTRFSHIDTGPIRNWLG